MQWLIDGAPVRIQRRQVSPTLNHLLIIIIFFIRVGTRHHESVPNDEPPRFLIFI